VHEKQSEPKALFLVILILGLLGGVIYFGAREGMLGATQQISWWVAFCASAFASACVGLALILILTQTVRKQLGTRAVVWCHRIVAALALPLLVLGAYALCLIAENPPRPPTYAEGSWYGLFGLSGVGIGLLMPYIVEIIDWFGSCKSICHDTDDCSSSHT
jgi:hypothetical protein